MDLLFRIAILALGYFYPAYKCFKVIDLGKPRSEQLHLWCQYWIIIAIFTGFERVADTFISWLPFYSGAKLAFVVYLWHPDTKGTEYIYQTFVKPYLSEHRESVDLNLVLVKDEAVRVFTILCDRLVYYVHMKVDGILHQNAVPLPNTATQLTQDGLHFYPSISSSFCEGKMQQQQWSSAGHQPLVTQSAIWPREQYQWQPKASTYPVRAVGDQPLGLNVRPTQPSSHHTLPSQPVAKAPNWPEVTKSSTLLSTVDPKKHTLKAPNLGQVTKSSTLWSTVDPKNQEGKEEIDFELVHANEVPMPESSAALDSSKKNTSAQGARPRWWWW